MILCWKDWVVDDVEDHFEVHVDEGGSRSSESNFERWRHVIVSLQNVVLLECWSQCPPRWLHGWTRCPWEKRNVTIFFRSKLFFHCVCTWAVLLHKLPCSIVSLLNTDVFRQFLRFLRSIWRNKFFVQTLFIDLVGTGRFTFNNKHIFSVIRFPRLITDWFWDLVGLVGRMLHVELLQKTVERVYRLAVVQLWNPIHHSLWSNRDRVVMRSPVVVEEIWIISHTRPPVFNLTTFGTQ